MKRSTSTWKRVAMSLRGLKERHRAELQHTTARRQLRVERLQARELLAADTFDEPALQYTGGITIAAEVASPDVNADSHIDPLDALVIANALNASWSVDQLPATDLNQDQLLDTQDFATIVQTLQQQGNLVAAPDGTANMQALGSGTVLDDTCAANEITISMLQAHVDVLRAELETTLDPMQRAFLEANIASLEDSIASLQEDLNCGSGGGGEPGEEDEPAEDEGSGTAGSEATGDSGGTDGSAGSGGTGGSDGTGGSPEIPLDPSPEIPPDEPSNETPGSDPPDTPVDPDAPTDPPGESPESPEGPSDGPPEEHPDDLPPQPPSEPDIPPELPGDMPTGGGTDGTLGGSPPGEIPPTDIPPDESPSPDDPPAEIPPEEIPPGEGTLGGEGVTGATEFYVKELKLVPQGYSQGIHGSEIPPLYEGEFGEIRGTIDGPRLYGELLTPPRLTLQIDLNSDGDYDDPHEQTYIESGPTNNHEAASITPFFNDQFNWSIPLADDGPVPGDGELSNVITVRAFFGDLSETQASAPQDDSAAEDGAADASHTTNFVPEPGDLPEPSDDDDDGPRITATSAKIFNVDPYWTRAPELTWQADENGQPVAVWDIRYNDVGNLDAHKLQVRWGDGPAELLDAVPQDHEDCEDASQGLPCPHEQTVLVMQQVPATAREAESVTLSVHDDDTGNAEYTILNVNVLRNNDDDDGNEISDLLDPGHENDDDLVELDLSKLFTEEMDPQSENYREGTLTLKYDYEDVLIWESRDKKTLLLPSSHSGTLPSNAFQLRPQGVEATTYNGQKTVWIEGITPSRTTIRLDYNISADQAPSGESARTLSLGRANVTVWGIDADMDSDNNNNVSPADHSEWEEYLEDSKYALGKLLNPTRYTSIPISIQLTPHLEPAGAHRLIITKTKYSGDAILWNRSNAGSFPDERDVREGGNRLIFDTSASYSLEELGYDPDTGKLELHAKAISVTPFHDDKEWIDKKQKLEDHFTFAIAGTGVADSSRLSDTVKWMAVNSDTFYPQLDENRHIRSLAASDLVYGDPDAPPLPPPFDGANPAPPRPVDNSKYALKMLSEEEVSALFPMPSTKDLRERTLDVLFNRKEVPHDPSSSVHDLQAALYLDHAAKGAPAYILAFRGTENNLNDWFANLSQLLTPDNSQYQGAIRTAQYLLITREMKGRLTTAGHSLGGGLASAAAVANNIPADTFNAAGVQRHTIGFLALPPSDENPYDALANFDTGAKSLVNAYIVYPKQRTPATFHDAPDLLNFLQLNINRDVSKNLNLIPDALGTTHALQGLHQLTPEELTFLNKVREIIREYINGQAPPSEHGSAPLLWLNNLLQLINAYENWESVYEKLSESHRLPSIWYGLLHGNNWNNYDGREVSPDTP